jgi:hypothetical protein
MAEPSAPAERRSPYDLVFGPAIFESDWFPSMAAEVEARHVEARDLGRFLMLGSVGNLLRALRPAEEPGTPRDAVAFYGALTFHAYHFWLQRRHVVHVSRDLLRALLDGAQAIGAWQFQAPAPAGYVELPRNVLWTSVDEATPEPVDGWFWVMAPDRIELLLCTGVRAGRAGLGVIENRVALPAPPPGHWGDLRTREDSPDFSNVLPGGELGNLHAIINVAELLKLVSRVFWHSATEPRRGGESASPA